VVDFSPRARITEQEACDLLRATKQVGREVAARRQGTACALHLFSPAFAGAANAGGDTTPFPKTGSMEFRIGNKSFPEIHREYGATSKIKHRRFIPSVDRIRIVNAIACAQHRSIQSRNRND
jgi:hypothetical protein